MIPHELLLFPVQDFAAACAELASLGLICAAVSGTKSAVNASHDDVRPLKRISLKLHFLIGSQVMSSKTSPFGKKDFRVFPRRPSTGVFHFSSPFVCTGRVLAFENRRVDHAEWVNGEYRGPTYKVIHVGSTHQVCAVVVGPLVVTRVGAVICHLR